MKHKMTELQYLPGRQKTQGSKLKHNMRAAVHAWEAKQRMAIISNMLMTTLTVMAMVMMMTTRTVTVNAMLMVMRITMTMVTTTIMMVMSMMTTTVMTTTMSTQ